jgi:DNA-binding transcriptional MocR family regulator
MDTPLYRRVADRLTEAIRSGTFRQGDKLPSVRVLARDWDLGINTVIEAYRGLELDGLIAARPQAGFYVSLTQPLAEPTSSQPPQDPTPITIGDLALRILTDGRKPGMITLGAAIPDPDKLPQAELARIMRRLLADEPSAQFTYAMVPGRSISELQLPSIG